MCATDSMPGNTKQNRYSWDEFRKLRRDWLLLLALYVPVCFGVLWLSGRLFESATPAFVFAIAWVIALGVQGFRMVFWPCPRCGHPFLWPGGFLAIKRRCSYCGLKKWSTTGEATVSVPMSDSPVMKTFRRRILLLFVCMLGVAFLIMHAADHGILDPHAVSVLSFMLCVCAVVGMVVIRRCRTKARAAAPPPGTPVEEVVRQQRLHSIRIAEIAIGLFAVTLVFSLFLGFPKWVLLIVGISYLTLIATLAGIVVRLKRSLK